MKSLHLRLLGGFTVTNAAGEKIAIAGGKAALILALLALKPGQAQSRARLMALLWSDRDQKQARGSLRQALWALRRALEAFARDEDKEKQRTRQAAGTFRD